jgi:uncharacterized protein (TIGR02284 family)
MNTANKGHAVVELNRIIGVARDGQGIYAKAVAGVQDHDPQLSALMMRMADANTKIVRQLTRLVRQDGGRPARHGTALGHLRGYFGWLGGVLGDAAIQYVSEGHASEARMIRALDVAATDAQLPDGTRVMLEMMLRDTRRHHDQLHAALDDMRRRDV